MKKSIGFLFIIISLFLIEIILLIRYFITRNLSYFYFIGVLLLPLILLIYSYIKELIKEHQNKEILKNNFKSTLKEMSINKPFIMGSYFIDGKKIKFKQMIEYDLTDLLSKYNIEELPILVSITDINKSILDETYIAYFMEKRNNEACDILTVDNSKNKTIPLKEKGAFFKFLIFFSIISFIILICYFLKDGIIYAKLFIIAYLSAIPIIGLLYLTDHLIHNAGNTKINLKKLSQNKIKVVGYIESIRYESDISTSSDYENHVFHIPNPYYLIEVSYVFKNKIYVITSSEIHFKIKNLGNFIPVMVDKDNPKKAYVDTNYLK